MTTDLPDRLQHWAEAFLSALTRFFDGALALGAAASASASATGPQTIALVGAALVLLALVGMLLLNVMDMTLHVVLACGVLLLGVAAALHLVA
jgi:hypothetical protein